MKTPKVVDETIDDAFFNVVPSYRIIPENADGGEGKPDDNALLFCLSNGINRFSAQVKSGIAIECGFLPSGDDTKGISADKADREVVGFILCAEKKRKAMW